MTPLGFCLDLLKTPGMGYVISSLVVVGMLIGALVKHAGWGVRDIALWLVVGFTYAISVQTIETQAGLHAGVPAWEIAAIMLLALFFYQIGIFVGVWIVKRERAKSRDELASWERILQAVNGADKDPPGSC